MDIGRSFTFFLDDDRWGVKWVITAVMVLLAVVTSVFIVGPILVGMLLYGYMVELVRNVRDGHEHPLPEWDRWGDKFADGFKLTIALFVWALPVLVLSLPSSVAGAVAGDDAGGAVGLLIGCLSCLIFLYSIFLALATPAIVVSFAEKGTFGSALDFDRVTSIMKSHPAEIVIVVIVLAIAGLLAGIVGLLLCIVGLFFTVAWTWFVQGHLYGQLAARASGGPVTTDPWAAPDEPMSPAGWEAQPPAQDADVVVADVKQQSQEALDAMDAPIDDPAAPPSVSLEPEPPDPVDPPDGPGPTGDTPDEPAPPR